VMVGADQCRPAGAEHYMNISNMSDQEHHFFKTQLGKQSNSTAKLQSRCGRKWGEWRDKHNRFMAILE
jgi:hypothetical protein